MSSAPNYTDLMDGDSDNSVGEDDDSDDNDHSKSMTHLGLDLYSPKRKGENKDDNKRVHAMARRSA